MVLGEIVRESERERERREYLKETSDFFPEACCRPLKEKRERERGYKPRNSAEIGEKQKQRRRREEAITDDSAAATQEECVEGREDARNARHT